MPHALILPNGEALPLTPSRATANHGDRQLAPAVVDSPPPTAATAGIFWDKVSVLGADDCWEWQSHRTEKGYGYFWNEKILDWPKKVRAHRFAFWLTFGEIQPDLFVLHNCDNPPCCNPAHLRLGTHEDNMRDMVERGRSCAGRGNADIRKARQSRRCAKLTEATVRELRDRFAKGEWKTVREAGEQFNIGEDHAARVLRGESWAHVPGAVAVNFNQARGERIGAAKLSEEQVRAILMMPGSHASIAREFNITPTNVGAIRARKTWAHVAVDADAAAGALLDQRFHSQEVAAQ